MSLASGLVIGGRRRAGGRAVPTVVVPDKPTVKASAASSRVTEVARGVLWAALLLAACALGSTAVAVVMVPAALIASISSWRALEEARHPLALAVAVAGPLVAALSFVVADSQSANLALVLALLLCVYDAGCYVNGNGRGAGGLAGVVAGLLSVAVVAFLVAAVLDPPFTGFRPWLVVGTAGLFAPLGVWLASRVPGCDRLPALRRLDSMILAAPAWVILVAAFVR